jgi:hypothetical protein
MDEKPDNAEPRRRWYQFSLRTLLIGVALLGVLCAWLGLQERTVRARQAWLMAHPQDCPAGKLRVILCESDYAPSPSDRPSFIRRWLGDEARDTIWVERDAPESVARSARELFPESQVWQQ